MSERPDFGVFPEYQHRARAWKTAYTPILSIDVFWDYAHGVDAALARDALPLYDVLMRREPTQSEMEEITAVVRRGDRLGAISLYISATEAGLTEAQEFVRALIAKEKGENPEATKKVD